MVRELDYAYYSWSQEVLRIYYDFNFNYYPLLCKTYNISRHTSSLKWITTIKWTKFY